MKKILLTLCFLQILSGAVSAQSVGTIDGVFDVSDIGAATYTVPIDIPQGINGLQPQLSVNYNSNAGNGILGVGWSLSGLSAITRSNNSIYNDQQVKGVELSSPDKFMLDGGRLLLISGSYGQAQSTYKTEIESYQNITAHGTLGNSPESFTVTNQDGIVFHYGISNNSRLVGLNQPDPIMWLLERVTDLHGNVMTYSYFSSVGEYPRIQSISYTKNTVDAIPGTYISFYYDPRNDGYFDYVGGTKLGNHSRLRSIYMQQNAPGLDNEIVGSYHFEYQDDFYSNLLRIKKKGHELNGIVPEELPPTQFQYGNSVQHSSVAGYHVANSSISGISDIVTGDFNGDGLSDYVRLPKYFHQTNHSWDVFLNTSNGFNHVQTAPLPQHTSPQTISKLYYNQPINRSSAKAVIDFNGDGKDDFFYRDVEYIDAGTSNVIFQRDNYELFKSNGSTLQSISTKKIVPHNNGSVSTPWFNPTYPLVGDFDGDGKTEILVLRGPNSGNVSITYPYSYNYMIGEEYLEDNGTYLLPKQLNNMQFDAFHTNAIGNGGAKLYVIDFDGDGKSEIMTVWSQPWVAPVVGIFTLNVTFDSDNKPVIGDPAFIHVVDGVFPTLYHEIFPGDFNGDGITDFLTWKSGEGWRIGYGNGKGLVTDIQAGPQMNPPVPPAGNGTRPILIADFNGDGKSDIYDYTPSNYTSINWGPTHDPRVHYSRGNNQFVTNTYPVNSSNLPVLEELGTVGDADGDGNIDLFHSLTYSTVNNVFFKKNEQLNLLQKITNGIGEEKNIAYLPITNTSVYDPGFNAYIYPYIKRTIPLKVVSSTTQDNGLNGQDKRGNLTSYRYRGLKFNAHGKGLMGFDEMAWNDEVSNRSTSKQFGLDQTFAFPYLLNQRSYLAGSLPLGHSIYEYKIHHFGNKRIFPYLSLSSTYDQTTNIQTDKLITYGTLGLNIGKPTVIDTYTGGIEHSREAFFYPQTLLVGQHSSLFSKPNKIETTKSRNGSSYNRTTHFSYHWTTAKVSQIVTDPGTSNEVRTAMLYGARGNMATKTITSLGLPSITENYSYDLGDRFVTQVGNSAYPSLATINTYNLFTGTLTSVQNSDGFTTDYTYDGFGRAKTITDNNGKSSSVTLLPHPNTGGYAKRTESNTAEPLLEHYDRLNRRIRTISQGFSGGNIQHITEFDAKGLVAKQSESSTILSPTWLETLYEYDNYGRVISEQSPSGNKHYNYTSIGNGLTIEETNAAGQVKRTINDRTGKTVAVQDDNGEELNYTYHGNGQLQRVDMASAGTVHEVTYDDFGRKQSVLDHNFNGDYKYEYNAYNELVSTTDPNGNTYEMTYNDLGQIATKTGPEGVYNYSYDYNPGPNSGKLVQVEDVATGRLQQYDHGMGDKLLSEQCVDGSLTLRTENEYDTYGRVHSRKYPNDVVVEYQYSSIDGEVEWIGRPGNTMYVHTGIYSVLEKNKYGLVTKAGLKSQFYSGTMPNPTNPSPFYGYTNYQTYDAFGLLREQNTRTPSNTSMRRNTYSFNPATGNLDWRKDLKYGLNEEFNFDNLNRLTQTDNSTSNESVGYGTNGNIETKSDAGSFVYDQANRLTEIQPHSNISHVTQEVSYTPFNKVSSILENPWEAHISYWPDGERSRMEVYNNLALQKTIDYTSLYDQETDVATGNVKQRCYVKGPDGNIVGIIETVNNVEQTYYVLTDHLGSVTQVLDGAGNIVEEKSYDAWGRLRDPQNWQAYPATFDLGQPTYSFNRGYTGHEHLPNFGIINMNGRLYDPVMGRMFSPDPYLMGMDNTQGFNRYTYCLNNPLSYTDPTGEIVWAPIIIGAAVGAYLGGSIANNNLNAFQWDYKSGRTWGYMGAGAVIGGLSGWGVGALGVTTPKVLAGTYSGGLNMLYNYDSDRGFGWRDLGYFTAGAIGGGAAASGISTVGSMAIGGGANSLAGLAAGDVTDAYTLGQSIVGGALSAYAGKNAFSALEGTKGGGKYLLGSKLGDKFLSYGLQASASDFAYTSKSSYLKKDISHHFGTFLYGGIGGVIQAHTANNSIVSSDNKYLWPSTKGFGFSMAGYALEWLGNSHLKGGGNSLYTSGWQNKLSIYGFKSFFNGFQFR